MQPQRLKVTVRGAVQGVGFRPFVYRLATEHQLSGWVSNSASGVFIEVESRQETLERFLHRLEKERPPRAAIQSLEATWLDALGYEGFSIRRSDENGARTALILPDLAPCADCLREIFDPGDRRYRYPFTNCTNCGPRFTIIEALPYDRPNTAMKQFTLCAACAREYGDPRDRRFHAQPNACPDCGPRLELWDATGRELSRGDAALREAAAALRDGRILALKGVGGFHLLVDARNAAAVARLRARKRREEKPFALMHPTLESVREDCDFTALEERLLRSPEAPIVLVRKRAGAFRLAPGVAPGNPFLGVMLPGSPLHSLLLADLGFPVVATSGNLSDEPICTGGGEALERLAGVPDLFLTHDRPIVRHADDSIVRVMCGREAVLRRARGYAPLPVHLKQPLPAALLGVGAHLKNNVALGLGTEVFLSQHIGDLETAPAFAAFRQVAADLPRLYAVAPAVIACDLHPDYLSTKFAREAVFGGPVRIEPVQHHWAHVLSCMAENELEHPVLGVAWDGTGYGGDGTIWGGEFLFSGDDGRGSAFQRVAHLRHFRLPGGAAAVREPRRAALGLLFEIRGEEALCEPDFLPVQSFSDGEIALLRQMLARGVNAPLTSSAGRFFDAVASLIGLRQRAGFEGQAAMDLEFAADGATGAAGSYPFALREGAPRIIDWAPLVDAILTDLEHREPLGRIAAKFHHTLAEIVVAVARRVGESRVVLTGGCFQNRFLLEACVRRLQEAGFRPYWHQRVPPNDGGIALGQVMGAAAALAATHNRPTPAPARSAPPPPVAAALSP